MPFTCKFVTAVGESDDAHTRLDLTPMDPARDYRRVQLGDGADFGWPQLSTVYAEGVGGDGDVPVASRYGNRRITLPIAYTDESTADQRRAAVDALARELDRDRNVLYLQAEGATEGRWLVTYRAAETAADLRTWGPPDAGFVVGLDAEPFAYGPLVTDIPWSLAGPGADPAPDATTTLLGVFAADLPASEGDAPTASSPGGQWYRQVAAADVLGDVDAPLNLVVSPPSGADIGSRSFAVATRPVPDDDSDLIRYHLTSAEGATASAPNTVTDSNSSGGDAARLPSTATLNTWYSLILGYLPAVVDGGVLGRCRELRGRWRVYARAKAGTSGCVFEVRASYGSALFPALTASRVTSTTYSIVDLGVMELPTSTTPADGVFGGPALLREPQVNLLGRRVAGTGVLDVDFLFVLPADGTLAVVKPFLAAPITAPYRVALDGDRDIAEWQVDDGAGGYYLDPLWPPVVPLGGMPRIYPKATTQLFVVPELGDAAGVSASLSKPLTVTASYRPRYLSVM